MAFVDEILEKAESTTIPEMFDDRGEAYFRKGEVGVFKRLVL